MNTLTLRKYIIQVLFEFGLVDDLPDENELAKPFDFNDTIDAIALMSIPEE